MVHVVTDYRGIICYLRKITMKEENSDVAYTVFLIETDRMIPFYLMETEYQEQLSEHKGLEFELLFQNKSHFGI